jgi:hypothetical protein
MEIVGKTKRVAPPPKRRRQVAGDHSRNTGPMFASQRCGARTRKGCPCKAPAVRGKRRCRMHGGAPGSGAPKENRNALKHGRYTREAIGERKRLRELVQQSRKLIAGLPGRANASSTQRR